MCDWQVDSMHKDATRYSCKRCGQFTAYTKSAPSDIHSLCRSGLGDWVAAGLSAIGIPKCWRCRKRQKSLNDLGKKIGL